MLISHSDGREAWLAMSAYILKGMEKTETIEIDFAGVKVLTPSWSDEVITGLAGYCKDVKLLNTESFSVSTMLKTWRHYSVLQI